MLLNHFVSGKGKYIECLSCITSTIYIVGPPCSSSWRSGKKLIQSFHSKVSTVTLLCHTWEVGLMWRARQGECVRKDISHQHFPFPHLCSLLSSPTTVTLQPMLLLLLLIPSLLQILTLILFSSGMVKKPLYSKLLTQHTLSLPPVYGLTNVTFYLI